MHSEILLVTAKSFWKVKIISKYYVRSKIQHPQQTNKKLFSWKKSLR